MTPELTELCQKMREAARRATPGPWHAYHAAELRKGFGGPVNEVSQTGTARKNGDTVVQWGGFDAADGCTYARKKANAAYIALCNPSNLTALLDALEEAGKEKEMAIRQAADIAFSHRDNAGAEGMSEEAVLACGYSADAIAKDILSLLPAAPDTKETK